MTVELAGDTRPDAEFFVPGRPAAQGSKAYKGHRRNKAGKSVPVLVEVSRRVKPWREVVAQVAALYWRGVPVDGPVRVDMEFVLYRPKNLRASTPTPPATTRTGDGDKLTRAVFDALTGVVFADDAQVTMWSGERRIAEFGEQPGCRIRVWRI